ncbi:MAG TPA: mechanosensitive ion channel family protein [Patescibacteria group bacterium]|nr:mechanosensitive ion channel family protein [Patescibacteria group bacterium]
MTSWLNELLTKDLWMMVTTRAIHIAVIFLGAFLALRGLRLLISQIIAPLTAGKALAGKRAMTLGTLLQSLIRYTVYAVVVMMLLKELQIDTTSIIAGAGFLGLAVGVGAQSLIKDMVTGFFIIFEDQFGVGDYIACGEMSGTVVDIGFRVTRLRDANGVLHIIPNGAILKVSNYTRGHMQAVVDVAVPVSSEFEQIMLLLEQHCRELDIELEDQLAGSIKVLGVVAMNTTVVTIRLLADTPPLAQFGVERAIRRKIIVALSAAGILPPPVVAEGGASCGDATQ